MTLLLLSLLACNRTQPESPVVQDSDTGPFYAPAVDCGERVLPEQGTLYRWPYLQNPQPDGITVMWGTTAERSATLLWGADASLGERATPQVQAITDLDPLMNLQHVTLSGLEPGTTYCYGLEVDGQVVASGLSFQTAPESPRAPLRFIALGDYGNGSPEQMAVLEAIKRHSDGVHFWVTLGDNAYTDGLHPEFQEKVFAVYQELWLDTPVMPTPGNHDWRAGNLTPYQDNFTVPRMVAERDEQEAYYTWQWGALELLALDSADSLLNVSAQDGDELDWLDQVLATEQERWRIAAWHHPAYTGQPNRTPELQVVLGLRPAVEEAGVPLILTGHNHMYERFSNVKADQKVEQGSTFITSGGGGASLYEIGPNELLDVNAQAHHFLLVDVDACTIRLRAISSEDEVLDDWSTTRC